MMTLDDLDDFGGFIAAEANHCEDNKKQKRLDAVFEKIQRLLETYTMSDPTRQFFETLSRVLLRCWIISFALGVFSFIVFMLTGKMIDEIHGNMFGLSPHELDLVIYCGLGFFKLFVLIFFFIPWVAIKLVLRNSELK